MRNRQMLPVGAEKIELKREPKTNDWVLTNLALSHLGVLVPCVGRGRHPMKYYLTDKSGAKIEKTLKENISHRRPPFEDAKNVKGRTMVRYGAVKVWLHRHKNIKSEDRQKLRADGSLWISRDDSDSLADISLKMGFSKKEEMVKEILLGNLKVIYDGKVVGGEGKSMGKREFSKEYEVLSFSFLARQIANYGEIENGSIIIETNSKVGGGEEIPVARNNEEATKEDK